MLARKQEINLQLNQLVDAVLIGAIFWVAHALRYYGVLSLEGPGVIPPFGKHLWMLAILMPFGPFLLELQGFYQRQIEKTLWRTFTEVMRAGVWLILIIGACVIFLRLEVPSRSTLILFSIYAPLVLITKERLLRARALTLLKRGGAGEEVVVAGEPERMQTILDSLSPIQRLEIKVVERVDLRVEDVGVLVEAVRRHSVGRVILAFSQIELDKVQKSIEACELEGVEAWLCADFIRTSVARPTYETLGTRPMLVFRATPEISWALMIKGAIDRVGALFAIVLAAPLLAIIAAAIRLSSPGPIIFRQQRAGLHGRAFTMFKFRSMVSGAETRRDELQCLNEMSGPVFKIQNDPRITPLGRWLRKSSMDELPQLFNVFAGDMSLVGPRPLPLYEVERFESAGHRRRLSMKPGLTCLWQVSGRSEMQNFDDWVRLDLRYIDTWSLGLDLWILGRTIPVVLLGLGAK